MSYQGEHIILSQNSKFILNLIRVLASQMVVIGHGISFFGIAPYLQPPYMPYMQNIAVVIFFLLSGFLIGNSVYQKRNTKEYFLKDFCFDRSVRIYTTFLPMLFVIVFLDLLIIYYFKDISYQSAFSIDVFITNILMLQDSIPITSDSSNLFLFGNTSFGSARPLWTIPVEWWTYLLFGLLILQTGRERNFQRPNLKKKVIFFLLIILSYFFLVVITLGARSYIKILLIITWIIGFFIMLLVNIKNKHQSYSFLFPLVLLLVVSSFYFFISHNITALILLGLVDIIGIILFYIYFYSESKFSKKLNQLELKIKNLMSIIIEKLTRRKEVSFIFGLFFITGAIYRVISTKVAYETIFIVLLSISLYFFIIFFNQATFKIPNFLFKIFQFLASYSFVLYIIHYSLLIIFLNLSKTSNLSSVLIFFLAFFSINIISILLALITERKTDVFKKKIKLILKLESSYPKNP